MTIRYGIIYIREIIAYKEKKRYSKGTVIAKNF